MSEQLSDVEWANQFFVTQIYDPRWNPDGMEKDTESNNCGPASLAMLMTARDIVTRLPDADAARVRLELAGNICRCTGYAGIVRAIMAVLVQRRKVGGEA